MLPESYTKLSQSTSMKARSTAYAVTGTIRVLHGQPPAKLYRPINWHSHPSNRKVMMARRKGFDLEERERSALVPFSNPFRRVLLAYVAKT